MYKRQVIAKVSWASYGEIISRMGIDVALNPLDIITSSIIRFVQGSKKILSSQLIQGQAEIMEIIATHHMKILNKPLKNLHLPDGIIIAAVSYTHLSCKEYPDRSPIKKLNAKRSLLPLYPGQLPDRLSKHSWLLSSIL